MPLFHVHGLIGALLSSLTAGASVVCTPGFDALQFFDWVKIFRPTWYTAVPTIHQAVLAYASAKREIIEQHPLRFVRSGSASLPGKVLADLEEVFRAPVIEYYGMTEAASQICSNPMPPGKRKAGSVGTPTGQEVAIMDPRGELLPTGTTGEIVIRGPNVTAGFENNPAANEEAFSAGWFRTGDEGRLDEDGYLFITGRIKEIINRGGEKVSPREVDEVLLSHPAVAQAVTFAVPHSRLGEDVAAAVVLRPTAAATELEVRQYCLSRLADHKVPSRVLFPEQLPKGPTGKVQRIGLYEKLAPLLKAEFTAPRSPLEGTLTDIWQELLAVDPVGIQDNFFELGGDSLTATQLISRLAVALDVNFPIRLFFEAPTIEGMAAAITRLQIQNEDPAFVDAVLRELEQMSGAEVGDGPGSTAPADHALQLPMSIFPLSSPPSPVGGNPGTEISTLAMPTCDRVRALERGLSSYVENSDDYGRSTRFAILDNSTDAATRSAYREMLRSLGSRYGATIEYAGLEDKTLFAQRLAAHGDLPLDVVRFGLFGLEKENLASFGTNRNAFLLQTVGEAFFAADDDTICRVSAAPELSGGLRFTAGCDPAEYWIFSDRESALRSVPAVEEDILTVHERLLGQDPNALASALAGVTAVDLERVDSALMRKLENGSGRVLATITGTLGDCAWGSPFGHWGAPMGYLLFEGKSHERLVQSEAAYRAACMSREQLRVVPCPTVSDGACVMGTFMAFDNRDLLPPHPPVGRGTDLTFGVALWKCFEGGYFGHVPYALLHSPLESRRFWPGEIFRGASGYDVDKLLIDCMTSHEFGPTEDSDKQRLRALGKHLMELGSMPLEEFEAFVRVQIEHTAGLFISRMEDQLGACARRPKFWADDVEKYVNALRKSILREDYFVPLDLMLERDLSSARKLSQLLVSKFGQLLYWWPDIVAAAKMLKAREQGLACRV
jgi:acyl carrier protein